MKMNKIICKHIILNLVLGCMPGYTGSNCTAPCLVPSYGEDCQGLCFCYRHSCDHVTGCTTPTTGKYFFISFHRYNT